MIISNPALREDFAKKLYEFIQQSTTQVEKPWSELAAEDKQDFIEESDALVTVVINLLQISGQVTVDEEE